MLLGEIMDGNRVINIGCMAGYHTDTMKGGYKAFRRFVLDQFIVPRKLAVIGGHTGTGKTDLLMLMQKSGHQVIDLEGLACHRGSAFGSLGMKEQPRNEQFENDLALQLYKMVRRIQNLVLLFIFGILCVNLKVFLEGKC